MKRAPACRMRLLAPRIRSRLASPAVCLSTASFSSSAAQALQGRIVQAKTSTNHCAIRLTTTNPGHTAQKVAPAGTEQVTVVAEQSWRGEALSGEESMLGKTFPKLGDVVDAAGEGDVIELHPGRRPVAAPATLRDIPCVPLIPLPTPCHGGVPLSPSLTPPPSSSPIPPHTSRALDAGSTGTSGAL